MSIEGAVNIAQPGAPSNPAHEGSIFATIRQQTAFLLSWAVAVGLIAVIGWYAVEPNDPKGAISLFANSGAFLSWIQITGIVAISAALATVVLGGSVPFGGLFAAALGMMVLSWRGSSAEYLLIRVADGGQSVRHLGFGLAIETLAWIGTIGASSLASGIVAAWCGHPPDSRELLDALRGGTRPGDPASSQSKKPGSQGDHPKALGLQSPSLTTGLQHLGLVLVAAMLLFHLFSPGAAQRAVTHGQACFAVAAAVWIGVYAVWTFFPMSGGIWSILGALALPLVGYLWASMQKAAPSLPAVAPPSHFFRVLPLQFVAAATAAAIASTWSVTARLAMHAQMSDAQQGSDDD